MRAFIAIELTEEVRNALRNLQERLKASQADAKWVEPENIHLTLKFLGDITEEQLSKIIAILDNVAADTEIFLIRISCLGAFPKKDFPRVIWVGIDTGEKETKELAKALENKIEKIGIPRENRPFSSHITIARIRSSVGRDKLVRELDNLGDYFKETPQEMRVAKITLFKSTLTPKGPVYEIVKETSLKTV
ncbi:MAG: RNA 2',3'-cyclic phosphodiesterase [Deltaproteobacteria bacterium]